MFDFIYRHILIRGFETAVKRRKTFAYWRDLERSQWLPREELRDMQSASLQELLSHAASSCTYYRDAWREMGFDPRDIRTPAELHHLPIIDRDTIRNNRLMMRAEPTRPLLRKATGGS